VVAFEQALGNGARFWMALQIGCDIWNAEQSFQGTVPPVKQLPEGKQAY
jgi:plasmid maintenance system antidote protein VapI